MSTSILTERALRAAVNLLRKDFFMDESPAEEIKRMALERGIELIKGNSTDSEMGVKVAEQNTAISLAVNGLILACSAVNAQLNVLNHKRLAFDKERIAGIATFLIPSDKEARDLSIEEQSVAGFMELAQQTMFARYMGIQSVQMDSANHPLLYSVLPFYRMSDFIAQPVGSRDPLDKQRISISLFFKAALPEAISDIDVDFQQDSKFLEFWKSAFKGENYLNNRRAPRLMMMGLANLLWNLQHPVDQKTGYPLSLENCIQLCREVELFLNTLLNTEAPPYLQEISDETNQLMSFIRKVEGHTKALRAAYAEEQLHALNIEEVTNRARHLLRIMDISMLKLIYKRANPVNGKLEPDEKSAEHIAYIVSYLNQLLMLNPNLLKPFQPYLHHVPPNAGMNLPLTTVIDGLILFCHLPWPERHRLMKELNLSGVDSLLEMAQILKKFDKHYVKPVRTVCKKILKQKNVSTKPARVAQMAAERIIPFMTLVLEDFCIEVDTNETYEIAKDSQKSAFLSKKQCGKSQIQAINSQAEMQNGYYRWALSPFVELRAETEEELDKLPAHQYRLTQVTKLLDSIREIVENYRSFLQDQQFQDFLLNCFSKVKEEYLSLDAHVKQVDACLAKDEIMSRSMQAILRPMMLDLNHSLEALSIATSNFWQALNTPGFLDEQRKELTQKIKAIDDLYQSLFGQQSGMIALGHRGSFEEDSEARFDEETEDHLDRALAAYNQAVRPLGAPVKMNQVVILRSLVETCFHSLSYQSRQGHKGMLLNNLLSMIDRQPEFTQAQIKHTVMELTRVVASYRQTWFFQAAYGHTRSAQVLINAVLDPHTNAILPLADMLFGEPVDFTKIDEAMVLKKLGSLREQKHWEAAEDQIEMIAAIGSPNHSFNLNSAVAS